MIDRIEQPDDAAFDLERMWNVDVANEEIVDGL